MPVIDKQLEWKITDKKISKKILGILLSPDRHVLSEPEKISNSWYYYTCMIKKNIIYLSKGIKRIEHKL